MTKAVTDLPSEQRQASRRVTSRSMTHTTAVRSCAEESSSQIAVDIAGGIEGCKSQHFVAEAQKWMD